MDSEPISFLFMLNEIPPPLLEPRRLGDLLLPNRVVMAPLTRGRASNPGHVPNDLMREYYEQLTINNFVER
jgi:N-ethylmaleimide reductase